MFFLHVKKKKSMAVTEIEIISDFFSQVKHYLFKNF